MHATTPHTLRLAMTGLKGEGRHGEIAQCLARSDETYRSLGATLFKESKEQDDLD